VQDPLGFDRLLPYNAAADLLSMDVYPVPTGSGHVLLPDGSDGPASVGRYPNEWFPIFEQRLQPPPQARTAVVRLRTYGPGLYWFDDITFG
jgi:hypothetical protein